MMSDQRLRAGAMVATAATMVITAGNLAAAVHVDNLTNFLQWTPIAVTFAIVAGVVLFRLPRNTIGWLMLVIGGTWSLMVTSLVLSDAAYRAQEFSAWASWLGWYRMININLLLLPIIVLVLLFPDGHLPSRRWRLAVVISAVVCLIPSLLAALAGAGWSSNYGDDPNLGLRAMADPLYVAGMRPLAGVAGPMAALQMVMFTVAAGSLVARYRRSGALQREQIKWVAAAVPVIAVGIAWSFSPLNTRFDGTMGSALLLPLLPVSIGVAVTRYRLYDIDRLISRTASYAIVTILLVGVFAMIVLGASAPLGQSSPLVVAAATLAAAALARPLLRRVQSIVDRRFNRSRYDATRTVEAFGGHLRDEIDPDQVTVELTAAIRATVEPSMCAVWLAVSS
jgi:hypothetical protein